MRAERISGVLPEPVDFRVDVGAYPAGELSDTHRDLLNEIQRAMEDAAVEAARRFSTRP